MSSTPYQNVFKLNAPKPIFKLSCIELTTCDYRLTTICTAVATAEHPAATVSFQRQQPNIPPTQNVNSAVSPLRPACHFSEKYAIVAVNAVTTATYAVCE